MRKVLSCVVLLAVGGCVSTNPSWPLRWQLSVPQAAAAERPVYVSYPAKCAEDGNTYSCRFIAITNIAHVDPDSEYAADIRTNRWPVHRTHVDLSLDGGQTWPRRIGYGVQISPQEAEFLWSPNNDYTLLSTSAVIRATMLDGRPFPAREPAMPYDVPAGQYARSPVFTIAGIQVVSPTNGQFCWADTPLTVRWRQAGAGSVVRVHYITPEKVDTWTNQCLAVLSNCVEMAWQERSVTMPPPQGPAKLLFISESDYNCQGYSEIINIE